jgi:hypothetical protein
MELSQQLVQQVWDNARAVLGNDPNTWRKDECGAWMKRNHYQNHDSEFGWKIENVSPGGPDEPSNLRAIHWQNEFDRASGHAHCRITADPDGIANKQPGA